MKRLFTILLVFNLLIVPFGMITACSSGGSNDSNADDSVSSSVEEMEVESTAENKEDSVAQETERIATEQEREKAESEAAIERERSEAEAAAKAEAEAAARAEAEAQAAAQAQAEAEARAQAEAEAARAQAEAEAAKMNQTVYMTKTGSCFHLSGCSTLSKSKIPITLREAREVYHLEPCGKCYSGRLLN